MSVTLTRQELYDRVWAEPVDTLTKEYGLSNVGLGKACRRHDIPVPPRGYWARKAAGQRVPPKRSVLRRAVQGIWRQEESSSRMDEIVAEIVPDTQPNSTLRHTYPNFMNASSGRNLTAGVSRTIAEGLRHDLTSHEI
jgi:hypothetical protein